MTRHTLMTLDTLDLNAALGAYGLDLNADLDSDVLRQAVGRRALPELLVGGDQPERIIAELRYRSVEPLAPEETP